MDTITCDHMHVTTNIIDTLQPGILFCHSVFQVLVFSMILKGNSKHRIWNSGITVDYTYLWTQRYIYTIYGMTEYRNMQFAALTIFYHSGLYCIVLHVSSIIFLRCNTNMYTYRVL